MRRGLLCALLFLGTLTWGCGTTSPEPENPEQPVQETLAGVKINRSGGSVYGEDFFISVVPGEILYMSVFTPERDYVEGEQIAISEGDWAAIETAIMDASLEEVVYRKPGLFDRLLERFSGKVEMLDGSSTTTLYLTWSSGAGTREAEYVWPRDGRLWDVVFGLAQSKVKEIPLKEHSCNS